MKSNDNNLIDQTGHFAQNPLDQFRAFQTLREKGLSEEDIAARFFVSTTVVKQRLKLVAASPKLLDVYATDGGMTLLSGQSG
jgi:ParB family transcriptional regulator, chromosome partitioning protein